MAQMGNYEDERRHSVIIEEILDLKLNKKQTQRSKLQIQKLQQELEGIEARLKI